MFYFYYGCIWPSTLPFCYFQAFVLTYSLLSSERGAEYSRGSLPNSTNVEGQLIRWSRLLTVSHLLPCHLTSGFWPNRFVEYNLYKREHTRAIMHEYLFINTEGMCQIDTAETRKPCSASTCVSEKQVLFVPQFASNPHLWTRDIALWLTGTWALFERYPWTVRSIYGYKHLRALQLRLF